MQNTFSILHSYTASCGMRKEGGEIMKIWERKKLWQILLGFFVGRISVFGMASLGIAFFGAAYLGSRQKVSLAISILAGMLTVFSGEQLWGYGILLFGIIFVLDLLERRGFYVHLPTMLGIELGFMALLCGVRMYFLPYETEEMIIEISGIIITLAGTCLLEVGQAALFRKEHHEFSTEELYSILFTGVLVILGIPDFPVFFFSLQECVVFFFLLLLGRWFGCTEGTIFGFILGIAMMANGRDPAILGMMTILGATAGVVQRQKRVTAVLVFCSMGVFVGYLVNPNLFMSRDISSFAIAGTTFLMMPEQWLKIQFLSDYEKKRCSGQYIQKQLHHKLSGFSDTIEKLANLVAMPREEEYVHHNREILENMAEEICGACERCDNCGGQIALMRPEMFGEISAAREDGALLLEQLPMPFMEECICKDYFLQEANRSLHLENITNLYENQIEYSRQVLAEQMHEMGNVVKRMATELPVVKVVSEEAMDRIKSILRKHRVFVESLSVYETFGGRLEFVLSAKTWYGRFVTTREVAQILSQTIGCGFKVEESCRKYLNWEIEPFLFVQCPTLRTSMGIARLAKESDNVSGDTFSNIELNAGELFFALSDGMGSGEQAFLESRGMIELLEQMMETGVSGDSALKLINAIYMYGAKQQGFVTADVVLLHLFKKEIQFLKCGASLTFFYHEKELETIEGEALPVGVVQEMDPYITSTGIEAGDYVIMMTDGVADVFTEVREQLESIILEQIQKKATPQELADELLEQAQLRSSEASGDDMSVLAIKIYRTAEERACKEIFTIG